MAKFSLFFGCFAGLFSADVSSCLPDCTFSARVDASVVVLKSNSTVYNLRPPSAIVKKIFWKILVFCDCSINPSFCGTYERNLAWFAAKIEEQLNLYRKQYFYPRDIQLTSTFLPV
jgi:hypothetical protein